MLAFDPQPWSGHWSVLGGTELMDPPTLRSLFSPGTAGMRKKKIFFVRKKKTLFLQRNVSTMGVWGSLRYSPPVLH